MSSQYKFEKIVFSLPMHDSVNSYYEFFDDLDDSSNDYNRLLTTFEKGAFIISGCRSRFNAEDVEGIKKQLDYMGVSYTQEELNKLQETNCDLNSGVYKHLIQRYNSKATYDLEKDLKNMGYGFRASYGGYQEDISSTPSKEFSFIVPYIDSKTVQEFQNDLAKLITKYIQDSGLIIHPNLNEGKPYYMKADKSIDFGFGQKKPSFKKEEDQYFTETKKTNSKPFVFKDANDLAKEYSKTSMKIKNQFSLLRITYGKKGWSRD